MISGTDSGSLLLWEGNFIKYRLVRPGGAPCHEGAVSSVLLLRDPSGSGRGAQVVSGGADGKLCWWDFKTIDEVRPRTCADLGLVITPRSLALSLSRAFVRMEVAI